MNFIPKLWMELQGTIQRPWPSASSVSLSRPVPRSSEVSATRTCVASVTWRVALIAVARPGI